MFKFEEGEQNIKIVRRHYLVILPMIFIIFILALTPIFIYYFLISNFLSLSQDFRIIIESFVSGWGLFAYSLWLLLLWIIFFIEWTDYYLDFWVITNKRIIDVEQKGFFYREVTSFSYTQIQDITVETKGLIETFFKFGTLHVQTAGHNRDIIIKDSYYPEEVRTLILKTQEQSKAI